MIPQQALRTHLRSNAAFYAITPRVYAGHLPESVTYPCASITLVFSEHMESLAGSVGLARNDVQLDCWAETYTGAQALAETARIALQGYSGTMAETSPSTGVGIRSSITAWRSRDSVEAVGDGTLIYRVICEFTMWAAETIPSA